MERKLRRKAAKAVAQYGREVCIRAYLMHLQGEGAATVGIYLGLTTRQADAAIDAGRELPWADLKKERVAQTMKAVMDRDTAEHFYAWLERHVHESEQHAVE